MPGTRRFILVDGCADSQEAPKSGASTSGQSTPALSTSSTTDEEDNDRVRDSQEDSDEADDNREIEADRLELLRVRLEALDVGQTTEDESEEGNAGPATERPSQDQEVENSGIDTEDAGLATDGSTGSANVSTTSTKH